MGVCVLSKFSIALRRRAREALGSVHQASVPFLPFTFYLLLEFMPESDGRSLEENPTPGVDRFAHFIIFRRADGQLDLLGRGAMGMTYRAWDSQLEREVALKLINPHLLDKPEHASRFMREAKIAAKLQHPHIAAVLHQGQEGAAWFYVMELIEGENLHAYIQRVGPLSPVHALQITRQILDALSAASRFHLIHRDLKPSNVMLTAYSTQREPFAKVIDFGLAKLLDESPDAELTGGAFLGTPEFCSPEQCNREAVDERSDLYSVGITLWYLLTGKLPFTGGMLEVVRAQTEQPPPLEELDEAPRALVYLVERLLAKRPSERPADASAAILELDKALHHLSSESVNYTPLPVPEPGVKRAPWSTARGRRTLYRAGGGVAAAAGLAFLLYWGVTDPRWVKLFASRPEETPAAAATPVPTVPPASAYGIPSDATGDFTNSQGTEFRLLSMLDVQVARTEVRVEEFREFAEAAGLPEQDWGEVPGAPAVNVSPAEALAFCQWLTRKEQSAGELSLDKRYRLPTPGEWEAMNGQENLAHFPWGHVWPPPEASGNVGDVEGYDDGFPHLAPVGSFPPNAMGLRDLVGNVREWVFQEGELFLIKGTGWRSVHPELFAVSWEEIAKGEDRADDVGFRLVLGRAPMTFPLP